MVLTVMIIVAFIVGCCLTLNEKPAMLILLVMFLILLVCGLLYGASYIAADSTYVYIGSFLRRKKIRIENIESIELFQPTLGAIRLCASGGFFGYWGIFREGDIGRYWASYGKASDCFLIRMRNGVKYVLGCAQPHSMVDYIRRQLPSLP